VGEAHTQSDRRTIRALLREVKMTWREMITQENLIGGLVEVSEMKKNYRGTVTAVEDEGRDIAVFVARWEVQDPSTDRWTKTRLKLPVLVGKGNQEPTVRPDGRIELPMRFLGTVLLTPNGWVSPEAE